MSHELYLIQKKVAFLFKNVHHLQVTFLIWDRVIVPLIDVNVFKLVDKLACCEVVHVQEACRWAVSLLYLVSGDRVGFFHIKLTIEDIWEVQVNIVLLLSFNRKLFVQRCDDFHILLDYHVPELLKARLHLAAIVRDHQTIMNIIVVFGLSEWRLYVAWINNGVSWYMCIWE